MAFLGKTPRQKPHIYRYKHWSAGWIWAVRIPQFGPITGSIKAHKFVRELHLRELRNGRKETGN